MSAAEHKLSDIEDLVAKQPTLKLHPRPLTEASLRPTAKQIREKTNWKRNLPRNKQALELEGDFSDTKKTTLNEKEAILEAARCLKCIDAPCQKGCPTSIDIKAFITSIANRNYYGAAKIIFSDNPVGMSCGMLCTTSELCTGNCNLAGEHGGAIDISGLQEFATMRFREMQVAQERDPTIDAKYLPSAKAKGAKIALIGCGPATISCATFLGRMGYTNVTVFEREYYGGGVAAAEVPEFRIPQTAINYEVQLMQDVGVQIQWGKELGVGKGKISLEGLRSDGYEAVFLGIGKTEAKSTGLLDEMAGTPNYFDSKKFLIDVMKVARNLPDKEEEQKVAEDQTSQGKRAKAAGGAGPLAGLPKLHGKVLVLGAGDVAMDCARSSFRCGAKRVAVILRRNTTEIRATLSEAELSRSEQVEFIPYCTLKQVHSRDGKIVALEFWKTEKDDQGNYVKDDDQTIKIKCDFVVSAYGATTPDWLQQALPVKLNKWKLVDVDDNGQTSSPWLFAGGDLIGNCANVEAANDGKMAAWGIHRYLHQQKSQSVSVKPILPTFHTAIDNVDLSIEVCGIKFPNPYGLASAPPTTSSHMIRRAFAMGWGYAVTKTFAVADQAITNVSPRIFSSVQGRQEWQVQRNGWMNIELISEKSHTYWLKAIKDLKAEFPDRIIIASIMSNHDKAKWQYLVKECCKNGADAIELNMSCPHGMHEKGMGLALGVYPDKVEEVVRWCVEASSIPIFAKLTPNVTDIATIAKAAQRGGAGGVTAINTVSGLVGFHSDATPNRWGVGKKMAGAYGGLSGNSVRPIALRAVHHITKSVPGFPIMATGGIDTADACMQFLMAGAPLMQICSAVMNQDLTIIQDLCTGLKTLLYMQGREDLQQWDRQAPTRTTLTGDSNCLQLPKSLDPMSTAVHPTKKFGKYELERRAQVRQLEKTVAKNINYGPIPRPTKPLKVPSVASFVAKGVSRVETNHMKLERNYQKVASINDDMCLNCGKCVMTCNDNGYQAIDFDPVSHIPKVSEEDCTGCGICESVCPALGCIEFIPRTTADKKSMKFLKPYRGEKKENGDADMPSSEVIKIIP